MATAQPKPLSKPVIFATSGLGGIMGWFVVHPFNTLAVRMNLASASSAAKAPTSFFSFASELVKTKGFMSLYDGLGAGCVRQIFYATSRFGLFETLRDAAAQYRKTDFAQRFAIASVAGGCAALISCPAEVSLVRMSNDSSLPPAERRNYKSVVDAATRIGSEEGAAAFFRGSQPFVMRAMLVGGTQVATYDQFKGVYASFGVTSTVSNTACASMSAGLIYSVITMPLETAKNRMAFQVADATGKLPYTGTIQTVAKLAKTEGVLALWNGFLPYYGRCGGHTVCMFLAVEELRRLYRKYLQ